MEILAIVLTLAGAAATQTTLWGGDHVEGQQQQKRMLDNSPRQEDWSFIMPYSTKPIFHSYGNNSTGLAEEAPGVQVVYEWAFYNRYLYLKEIKIRKFSTILNLRSLGCAVAASQKK